MNIPLILKLVMVVLFIAAAVMSGLTMSAALIQRNVIQELAGGTPPDLLRERILLGQRLDPWSPELAVTAAELATDSHDRLLAYRQLTRMEPYHVAGWLGLLESKLALGQSDEELAVAFDRVEVLGPFEPQVNERWVRAGARHWLLLGSDQRRQVVDAAVRGLSSRSGFRKQELENTLNSAGFSALVCAQLGPENCGFVGK